MTPRKAVFPVGGWGTRFLPATKAVHKAMFPIINKPIIHYAVEEVASAGIEQVIFVVTSNGRAIEEYFSPHLELEAFLGQRKKTEPLKLLRGISSLAHFSFTPAKPRGQFQGLGIGVLNAQAIVGEEPFAVVLPNDHLDTKIPCMKSLMEVYQALKCPVLAVHRVPVHRLSTYGNVGLMPLDAETSQRLGEGAFTRGRVYEITELIQKPDPEKGEHVSDAAIIGRYILSPEVFMILKRLPPGREGEVQLTDALEELRQRGQKMYAYEFEGQYFDTRSEMGYLQAILNAAGKRPELAAQISEWVPVEH
jgi:UTP--glucose-1-phosphate uridylyltransferase